MLFLTTDTNGTVSRDSHEKLPELVAAVESLGEQDGWPTEVTFRVSLVVDELVQNVLDYAYKDGSGDVEVAVTSQNDDIVIEITDEGVPFDPLNDAPEPDVTSAIEDRPVGGLGVHFAKTLMDAVEYSRDSQKNRLKIIASK